MIKIILINNYQVIPSLTNIFRSNKNKRTNIITIPLFFTELPTHFYNIVHFISSLFK